MFIISYFRLDIKIKFNEHKKVRCWEMKCLYGQGNEALFTNYHADSIYNYIDVICADDNYAVHCLGLIRIIVYNCIVIV